MLSLKALAGSTGQQWHCQRSTAISNINQISGVPRAGDWSRRSSSSSAAPHVVELVELGTPVRLVLLDGAELSRPNPKEGIMLSSTAIYYWLHQLFTRRRHTNRDEDTISIEGTFTPLSTVPPPGFYSRRSCYGGHDYGLGKNHSPVCVEYEGAGPEAIGEENSMITARAACTSYDYTVDTSILSQIWPRVEANIVEDEDSVPELVETMN
ncbi:hypothetical protein C8R45DRAFT_929788 [Mycena sanguinolenta]|nr:hypothetical protein C8R45DRAFT_929788 [Mycena sanguinolenta]